MEIDFDATDGVSDFVTVPAGTYLCRVAEVRPGTTRAGDQRWSLRLVVAEGQHVGKQAAWDSLVFSTRGRARARLVFAALGLPANGRVQVEAQDLEGREAFVQIRPAEYSAPSGETIRRNEVPYDGYRPLPDGGTRSRSTGNDDPDGGSAPDALGAERAAETRSPRSSSRRRGDASDVAADRDEIPF